MNQVQSEIIHISSFFTNYDFHPQMRFESVAIKQKSATHDVNKFISTMKVIVSHLHSEMITVQIH